MNDGYSKGGAGAIIGAFLDDQLVSYLKGVETKEKYKVMFSKTSFFQHAKAGTALPAGTSLEDQQRYQQENGSNPAALANLNNAPKPGQQTAKDNQAQNDKIVYHGTDSKSAQHIINNGLNVAANEKAGDTAGNNADQWGAVCNDGSQRSACMGRS